MKTVTVGIPAFNEKNTIGQLINSILGQNTKFHTLETIMVVCDGSTDGTDIIVKGLADKNPKIVCLADGLRKGKLTRLNEIYSNNTSEILITFDADIKLSNGDVIDNMVNKFDDERVQVVTAYDIPATETNIQQKIINKWYLIWTKIRTDYKGGDNLYNIHGNATALRGTFAQKVRYPSHITADQDFLYMVVKKEGAKFKYATDARILFHTPDSIKEFYFQTTRFLTEKTSLRPLFPDVAKDAYYIPWSRKIKKILIEFTHDPLFTFLAVLVYAGLIVFGMQADPLNADGMWEPVLSTKKALGN